MVLSVVLTGTDAPPRRFLCCRCNFLGRGFEALHLTLQLCSELAAKTQRLSVEVGIRTRHPGLFDVVKGACAKHANHCRLSVDIHSRMT